MVGCVACHRWNDAQVAELACLFIKKDHEGLVRGNQAIASLCGRKALGYRSPAWDLSPHTVELLIDEGFALPFGEAMVR